MSNKWLRYLAFLRLFLRQVLGVRNKHKSLGRVQSSEILNVPFKMRFLIKGFKNIPVNRRLLFTLNNQHL